MLDNKGFDLWADGYDKAVGISDDDNTYPFVGYKKVLGRIFRIVMEKPEAKVLDIGFGTGTLTTRLYEKGCTVYGQDFSAKMIGIAQEKMPEAVLVQGDFSKGLNPVLRAENYDFIISTYALHHLSFNEQIALIRELTAHLNPGGQILIGDVAFQTQAELNACRRDAGDEWDEDESYFVYEEMKTAFPAMRYEQISGCAGLMTLTADGTLKSEAAELQLYIPRREDGWFYIKMMTDPLTMSYNAPWFPPDGCIPEVEAEWDNLQAEWIGHEPERFYAFLQRVSDGTFVGDVNYHYNPEKDWHDMGIVIYAPERGKGCGRTGLRLLADRAFRIDGISRLHNDFETTRDAAYRIHKEAGFRETGVEDGLVQLELTKEEYLSEQEETMDITILPMTRERMHEMYHDFILDPDIFMDMQLYEQNKDLEYNPQKVDALFDMRSAEEGSIAFAIMLDDKVIGEVGLRHFSDETKECELSIHLMNDSVKNQGYGTKAEQLAINYAFDELGAESIFAESLIKNKRSQHILDKLGFKYLGEEEGFKQYRLVKADRESNISR